MNGKIIKGIAGVYTVNTEDGNSYSCKAKGAFRKDGIKPVIGDNVIIDVISQDEFEGNIVQILDRKNLLIRPSVANIDMALIVVALTNPEPNFYMLDKLMLHFKQQSVPIVLCFNKEDISDDDTIGRYREAYKDSCKELLVVSASSNLGIDLLREELKNKTTCIAGPSGVGKSTIINSLQTNVTMETGDISKKLKRGKHTTRHSEIIPVSNNTYIIDTPGFTSIDIFNMSVDELKDYYDEFHAFERCYFTPCFHIHEPDCGVKEAVNEGKISRIRYENYCQIYEELKRKRCY